MICKPCLTAGELNKRGRGLRKSERDRDAESAFEQARFFHDECRGCDCQHTVAMDLHD